MPLRRQAEERIFVSGHSAGGYLTSMVALDQRTEIYELEGFNHGEMAEPAHQLLLRLVRKVVSRN